MISSELFHRQSSDIVVCAITSQSPTSLGGFEYLLSKADLAGAGLPKLSKIKCGKIVTLDSRIVRKKLGQITPATLSSILDIVHQAI